MKKITSFFWLALINSVCFAQNSNELINTIDSCQIKIDSLNLELDKLEQQIDYLKYLRQDSEEKLRLSSVKGINDGNGIEAIARVSSDLGPFQLKDKPGGKKIGTVPINAKIIVFAYENNFYKIKYKNTFGYVVASYLKLEPAIEKLLKRSQSTSYGNPSSTTTSPRTTSRTIYTGPRGGRYYINKNGNKTYLKRNKN